MKTKNRSKKSMPQFKTKLPPNFAKTNIGKRHSLWPEETAVAVAKDKGGIMVAVLGCNHGGGLLMGIYAENEQSMNLAREVQCRIAKQYCLSPDDLDVCECWHSDNSCLNIAPVTPNHRNN